MYSTILFDFDGTLTSSLELWLQAFHHAFSQYKLRVSDELVIQRCFYRPFHEVVTEFNLPCVIEFGQFIQAGLWIHFEEAKLFAGVKEVLAQCSKKKIRLAVVTSSPRRIVERTLANLEIDIFFSSTVTADDIVNFKPHPEPVLLALERLNSDPAESLLVGDSTADILAGQAAGVRTGLFFPEAHTQFYDFQKLIASEPHFVFHNYEELPAHLGLSNE